MACLSLTHCQSTSESTEIIRYDIASGCRKQQWCGGRGPVLESPVTGWAQDGRLYVFGIDRGSMSETAALWHVSLNEPAAGWRGLMLLVVQDRASKVQHPLFGVRGRHHSILSAAKPTSLVAGTNIFQLVYICCGCRTRLRADRQVLTPPPLVNACNTSAILIFWRL